MDAYLTADEAATLGADLPGLADLLALDDGPLLATLTLATVDIDSSMRYQGRKYDPTQTLEFPRIDASPAARQFPPAPPSINDPSFYVFGGAPTFIWDWDPTANGGQGAAVVPDLVKMACLYQAAWLLRAEFADRLEAIRSGLVVQKIATGEEMLAKAGEATPGGFTGLSDRASRIMERYRLRSGRIL